MLRRAPASLEVGVTITTRRLLRRRVVVAEEASRARGRRIERRAILIDDVVFARCEQGRGEQRGLRQGERAERHVAHGTIRGSVRRLLGEGSAGYDGTVRTRAKVGASLTAPHKKGNRSLGRHYPFVPLSGQNARSSCRALA